MKKKLRLGFFIVCFFSALHSNAQKNKNKLPEITAKDFELTSYDIDSTAQAVILFDGGEVKYKTDGDAWFEVMYTYKKRVRLLNKNAFDLGTIEIPLYKSNDKEDRVNDLKACTYTLENNKVVKNTLDKSSLFNDRVSNDVSVKKFTLPNLQEGCIIEYEYTLISPRPYYLRTWYFQDRYPVLHSQYQVTVPVLFNFIFLPNGGFMEQPAVDYSSENFTLLFRSNEIYRSGTDMVNFHSTSTVTKWSIDNLPAIKKENYTTNVSNYVTKVEFQLKSIDYPGLLSKPFMSSWPETDSTLRADNEFSADIRKDNNYMNDDLRNLINADSLQTAKNIYRFVRDNFTCMDYDAIYLTENLKSAYKTKKGNVADLNMVLTAMLIKAGFRSNPVLLSTRDHGFAYELYPLLNKFNYVISRLQIGDKQFLLDATQKKMGFDHLPLYCYNGGIRNIDGTAALMQLSADDLQEIKNISVKIVNGKNKTQEGSFHASPGYYESYNTRNEIASSGREDYLKKIKSAYSFDADVKNIKIDSLEDLEKNISVSYDFSFKSDEGLIYFNPMLTEARKTNPFSAATRYYPVEMPYTTNETYSLSMEIPEGYVVDDIPRSTRVMLNEADGKFEYIIKTDGKLVTLTSKLMLNIANYNAEAYANLREFFGYVVKKQNESVVFKKIN